MFKRFFLTIIVVFNATTFISPAESLRFRWHSGNAVFNDPALINSENFAVLLSQMLADAHAETNNHPKAQHLTFIDNTEHVSLQFSRGSNGTIDTTHLAVKRLPNLACLQWLQHSDLASSNCYDFFRATLSELRVTECGLQRISGLSNFRNLCLVDFSRNHLHEVQGQAFFQCRRLETVLLRNNEITHIDPNAFVDSPVKTLCLSGNRLPKVPIFACRAAKASLQFLHLVENPLTYPTSEVGIIDVTLPNLRSIVFSPDCDAEFVGHALLHVEPSAWALVPQHTDQQSVLPLDMKPLFLCGPECG